MIRRRFLAASLAIGLTAGCQTRAPIHVWSPPQLASTVGKRVAIVNTQQDEPIVESVRLKMLQTPPRSPGRQVVAVDAQTLRPDPQIRLVSGQDKLGSDLALLDAARRGGVDFVLLGGTVDNRSKPNALYDEETANSPPDEPIRLSWKLMSVEDGHSLGGSPVVLDANTAVDHYPDLAIVGDRDSLLTTAAARQTYRLLSPWVREDMVPLANPHLSPGSSEVRRGNLAAEGGRWSEAEAIWSAVAEAHPRNAGAAINLAIAAVAGQDFETAKRRISNAIRRHPTSKLAQTTLVWIEQRQREYHEAFRLPEPVEGWFITR